MYMFTTTCKYIHRHTLHDVRVHTDNSSSILAVRLVVHSTDCCTCSIKSTSIFIKIFTLQTDT